MANQPDTVVVDRYIENKVHKKLKKHQRLKGKVEKMWEVKAAVTPVVIRGLGAVASKPEERLQQIPGTTYTYTYTHTYI